MLTPSSLGLRKTTPPGLLAGFLTNADVNLTGDSDLSEQNRREHRRLALLKAKVKYHQARNEHKTARKLQREVGKIEKVVRSRVLARALFARVLGGSSSSDADWNKLKDIFLQLERAERSTLDRSESTQELVSSLSGTDLLQHGGGLPAAKDNSGHRGVYEDASVFLTRFARLARAKAVVQFARVLGGSSSTSADHEKLMKLLAAEKTALAKAIQNGDPLSSTTNTPTVAAAEEDIGQVLLKYAYDVGTAAPTTRQHQPSLEACHEQTEEFSLSAEEGAEGKSEEREHEEEDAVGMSLEHDDTPQLSNEEPSATSHGTDHRQPPVSPLLSALPMPQLDSSEELHSGRNGSSSGEEDDEPLRFFGVDERIYGRAKPMARRERLLEDVKMKYPHAVYQRMLRGIAAQR